MLRVSPFHDVANRSFSSSSRDEIFSFCFLTTPLEFLTLTSALPPLHSILPSHSGSGAICGSASPISYRHAFWLLEPELRTRIFMLVFHRRSSLKTLGTWSDVTTAWLLARAPDELLLARYCRDLTQSSGSQS